MSNKIAVIDPLSGNVKRWVRVDALTRSVAGDMSNRTPNGIGWKKEKKELYLSGKLWQKVFLVDLKEKK